MREVITSIHAPGITICGIAPKVDDEPVRLDRNYHPGFGGMRLMKNLSEVIWDPRPYQSRQLDWIDKHILDDDAIWTLEVDGPLVSFVLLRRQPGIWVVSSSSQGFA